ncbi:hypothetical protein Tco_0818209 [Tanacetum coccineum]
MATLNELSPLGFGSDSGPRGYTLGSGEDSMQQMELMEFVQNCVTCTASATPEVSTTAEGLVYIRRSAKKKKDKGKAIMIEDATPEVSTAAEGLVYIRRSAKKKKDKGKAIMIEDESVQKKSKNQKGINKWYQRLCSETLIKKLQTRITLYSIKEMDLETTQNNVIAKLPLLKQGDYEMWKLRIVQHFQVQDYALWKEKASDEIEVLLEEEATEIVQDHRSGEKGEQEVTTADTALNTANVPISIASETPEVSTTAESLVYIRRSAKKKKDKGKSIIIEDEFVQKKSKKQVEEERLGHEEAIRLQEHIDDEERKRDCKEMLKLLKQFKKYMIKLERKEAITWWILLMTLIGNDPSV